MFIFAYLSVNHCYCLCQFYSEGDGSKRKIMIQGLMIARVDNIKCKQHSLWAIRRRRLKAVGEMRSSIGGNWQDVN